MRAVVQRVRRAKVEVAGGDVATIGRGLLVFLGVAEYDTLADASYLAEKIAHLRIFEDEQGKMNLSAKEVNGSALVVSNFTLYGDCRKGRRPSFTEAAGPELGRELFTSFVSALEEHIPVATGEFQATMQVYLQNDGPVTLLLDSRKVF